MAQDKILHFADHHDEVAAVIPLPPGVRAYRDYLEHFHRSEQGSDLPDVPDEFPDIKAVAQINQGRWLWRCQGCNNGTLLDADTEHSICPRCAFNGWIEVEWPENKAEIEAELLKMAGNGLGRRLSTTVREWRQGWTLEYLEKRTEKALELSKLGGRVRALSIGARRIWTVGEILTADHQNTYVTDIEDDLAGANGIIELETDPVNNTGGLRIPRLTTAQRTAQTATDGTQVYDTTADETYRYQGGEWLPFTRGEIEATFERFTANGTYTVPETATFVYAQIIGGGCSGARDVTGSAGRWFPTPPGSIINHLFRSSDLSNTETVVVGAGGDYASVSGGNQVSGGNSSFAGITARGGQKSSTGDVSQWAGSHFSHQYVGGGWGGWADIPKGLPGLGLVTETAVNTDGEDSLIGTGSGGGYANAGNGGDGGTPGGAGGNTNTTSSQVPGNGARGEVRVWSW